MAEALLLTVVRGVAGKAADELVQRVTRMWGVDGHRRELERHLVYVQSLLADAEAKSETNHAIRAWTRELKAAAYQADDILDNFQYEALHREAMSGQPMASKVLSHFTSKNQLLFRYKASRDLKKVVDKINKLVVEMNVFGLVALKEVPAQALSRQTHSGLDESLEIIGRDDDKEAVVKLLLDKQDRQDVQVLPIIGMGGVGKTALAKMVYNDQRVQKHFELKMWHCVSDNFEATAVVRAVIQLATKGTCDLPDNIELLRGRLQETIGQKRFLLVLDDVWNEEQQKWEDDLRPLLCYSNGGSGSMIVVTSRNQQVATIMGTLPHHELSCLSEGDSWKLFSKKAFNGKGGQEQQLYDELVTIGKHIAYRCKGLPLALKTMGGLMSSMHQVHEWETIAENNMGDTIRGNEVLSILKLSYRHLSSEMKQCFAFCALFPKDYEMEKDKLIQLWMANGYICEDGNMDLAKKGELIFNELAWRSFLQDVNVQQSVSRCKMHDLMHDLANDVTDECALARELSQKKASIEGVRHMQLEYGYESEDISELLKGTPYLRTLLIETQVNDLKDLKLMPLRALSYQSSTIIHRQLINTAHLRYLDLSGSHVVRLPSSICTLYHLQSLRLDNCYRLRYLPEGISTLRKLSHLYLSGCHQLERMPPKLSLLHNLRTLTIFIVGASDGFGIEELKDLRHLRNRLELYNLRKVKSGSKANLHEKQNLSELLLYWGRHEFDNPTNVDASNDEQVLESLAPHSQGELKLLEVHGYGGLAIPHWMKDPQIFLHLKELTISHCPGCIDLPIVWVSSCLEILSLSYMNSLTTLCRNINVDAAGYNTPLQMFRNLKRMKLWHLPELERWAQQNSPGEPSSSMVFPMLEELSISHCGKLASPSGSMLLGSCPSLVHLEIGLLVVADVAMPLEGQQNQGQRPLDTLRFLNLEGDDGFASIFNLYKLQLGLGDCLAFVEELTIYSCCNIVCWPVEELKRFPCLRYLWFDVCTKLVGKGASTEEILPLPQLKSLNISFCDSLLEIPMLPLSLEIIQIRHCKSLEALPSNLGNLVNLKDLNLYACNELKALPGGLTSLESLRIYQCPRVDKFPQDLLQKLPSLKYLGIDGCPDLQGCCRQGGEYIDLVSTIQEKRIPFPATSSNMKKVLKKLLPSC